MSLTLSVNGPKIGRVMVSMETKEETKNTLAVKLVAYHEDGQLIN